MKVFRIKTFGMSDENIPLTILRQMNNVEKQGVSGEYKKEIIKQTILEAVDDNIDIEKLVDNLIELLVDISKKRIKILLNKSKCI